MDPRKQFRESTSSAEFIAAGRKRDQEKADKQERRRKFLSLSERKAARDKKAAEDKAARTEGPIEHGKSHKK
jgi:hypothetical protein